MKKYIDEHIEVTNKLHFKISLIETIANTIINAYRNNKKVIIFGNGGSAVDSEHMVTELVSKFKINRKGLNAISLSSNSAILTAIGNDFDYDEVFSRQLIAYANEGDIVIALSTSGTSPNIVKALETAHNLNTIPILITGNKYESPHGITLQIESDNTPRIQEVYMLIIHMVCEEVEKSLFLKGV